MPKLMRIAAISLSALAAATALGFVAFALVVMRAPEETTAKADGIVVLTGGETRISEAARLLREGRGDRLLISGVNRHTGRQDLIRLSGLEQAQFNCCVDIGYTALNTIGNANETRSWAEAMRYDTLIIVTSSYHMPRSIAELARELPNTTLIAHPVQPRGFNDGAWWLRPRTARVLASEYLKFLPAAARYAASRVIGPWGESSMAEVPAEAVPPANI
jgi:uncharacterized SAM-binding protein YcdF (DUF218 family)